MELDRLREQLRFDEGVRAKPYADTDGKTSIGVGRNLTDRGLSDDEINMLLTNDIALAARELDRVLPWWRDLNDARQNVLLNMMFNMGAPRLLGFVKMLTALHIGHYDEAAAEMLDSIWAKQVGVRALRLAAVMRKGEL